MNQHPNRLYYTVHVRRHEVDSFGHVNNAVYLNYLEEANCDLLDQLGFPVAALKKQGVVILLKKVTLDFKSPAFHGDTLTFETWLIDLQAASGTWRHEVYNQNRTLILLAEDTGVFLSTETGRPVRVPEPIHAAVQPFYAPTSPSRLVRT